MIIIFVTKCGCLIDAKPVAICRWPHIILILNKMFKSVQEQKSGQNSYSIIDLYFDMIVLEKQRTINERSCKKKTIVTYAMKKVCPLKPKDSVYACPL